MTPDQLAERKALFIECFHKLLDVCRPYTTQIGYSAALALTCEIGRALYAGPRNTDPDIGVENDVTKYFQQQTTSLITIDVDLIH